MSEPVPAPRNAAAPSVSIATTVLNEEQVLPQFLQRALAVLEELPGSGHELVVVDDGSTDGSLAFLEAACAEDERLRLVVLSRNFGHQRALRCAMDHCAGDVVVLMDADLQDPPETIATFLEQYRAGYDVVYARRVGRKEGLLLRCAYFLFYRLLAVQSQLRLPLDAGDFSLLSRRVVEAMAAAPESHRYLRGLRAWVGFPQIGIDVERAARAAGCTKYGPLKLLSLAGDGLFAFSTLPLRLASAMGCAAMTLATGFGVYSLYAKFVQPETPVGFTALILAIVFLSGVQLLSLGVIGEYLGRVYDEVKARPPYVVQKRVGGELK
ncbi:MAG: glycosyltransferase involved in cell wall biosynthesis [Planctomycetota bacterium]|jgi:glycosyltransferase involved in cell wall biosynthesis